MKLNPIAKKQKNIAKSHSFFMQEEIEIAMPTIKQPKKLTLYTPILLTKGIAVKDPKRP